MTRKIFRSTLMVAAAVLAASLVIVLGCLYDYFGDVQKSQLRDKLRLAACGVEASGQDYLERLASQDSRRGGSPDYRLTWVGSDGTVLFDTHVPVEEMENHGSRIEIREALLSGESSSVRYSDTLTQRTLYYACALDGGTVLRVSAGQATELALVLGMLQPILVIGILAAALSAVLAGRVAKRIVRPLNSLDLDHPLENDAYEELTPLLRRVHQQRGQISAQLRELRAKTDEFEQITSHMSEGLVVLDREGAVLSVNPAAQAVFGVDRSCAGRSFLTVDPNPEMSRAVRAALEEGRSSMRSQRGGREYQFDLSRIQPEGTAVGVVLLAFDVTERACAERSRREFTANVSHELKTPLQSILGSAELLKNGLVKPEDIPHFSSLIYRETSRLVTLVDDIIHLSQLDEGVSLAQEPVNLLEIAESAACALSGSAGKKRVRVSVSGEPVQIRGVGSFLYEMVYNLCDNAIKYNVENGSVDISVSGTAREAVVTVRDTGIGIPPEYQSRVFERFFRVDKSRSKASGGTGLGLSIVKHIAQYHHGVIDLQSEPGKGAVISVTLTDKKDAGDNL